MEAQKTAIAILDFVSEKFMVSFKYDDIHPQLPTSEPVYKNIQRHISRNLISVNRILNTLNDMFSEFFKKGILARMKKTERRRDKAPNK